MGVGIVQVINNTSTKLQYKNSETSHEFTVRAKEKDDAVHCQMPCSDYHDDTVPWRSSNKDIAIWQSTGNPIRITDDNWHFYIAGTTAYTKKWEGVNCVSLPNGGTYILKIDEVDDGKSRSRSLTIYMHQDFVGNNGNGGAQSELIEQAKPVFGPLLYDW
jgi:transcription elongation factor